MPLQPCRECNSPCSTEAQACPKCGCPDPHSAQTAAAAEAALQLWRTQQSLRAQAYWLCVIAAAGIFVWAWGMSLRNFPIVFLGVFVFAGCVLLLLGGLPGAIARGNNHPQARAIAIMGWLGLLLSFGIFWLVALIWAHTAPARAAQRSPARST